ncbi:uncharacterized protein PV09_00466 [Verruconis gallopava]|uniref:Ubiquitin-like domain-containing protein n=1 Tax=Verruconis gallopava TaxID=253628 RepID=A0A0D1Z9F7_9PEZI|nr:uncharacterized protein PV09_00466 [Verruconis gallopava]KIW09597.1 hypothetical protein PV09_00466 [Verruconis gallopava]
MAGMTELAFARQFLTALDSRPIKFSSDHVLDPKQYPAQGAYIIPKLSSQPLKRKRQPSTAAPGAEKAPISITVSLKNSKSPTASYTLESQPLTCSVFDLKSAYAVKSGAPIDKIKLLYNKKPTTDSKTLKDLLGDTAESTKEVEFTVMVMGGIPAGVSPRIQSPELATESVAPAAQGVSGADVLKEEEFWRDLHGFLQQRIRDESEALRLSSLFRSAWQKGSV